MKTVYHVMRHISRVDGKQNLVEENDGQFQKRMSPSASFVFFNKTLLSTAWSFNGNVNPSVKVTKPKERDLMTVNKNK